MTNYFSKLFSNPFESESTIKKAEDEKSNKKSSKKGTTKGSNSQSGSGSTNESKSGSGSTGTNSGSLGPKKNVSGKFSTDSRKFESKYGDPFDRAKVLRLPGGPRGCYPSPPPWCCPPPPWGCPPPPCVNPPPPWGCCPPPPCVNPPPPWGCPPPPCVNPPPPWGCPPPPPMPGSPCFPPPFSPVCNFPPGGGRQIIRVPKGSPPPFLPSGMMNMGGGGISGSAQPCYNNCNFYSASDNNPNYKSPFNNSYQPPYSIPYGGMMGGDARPPFPFGDIMKSMPPLGGKLSADGGCGLSSSEDFFKDLDVLANSSCNVVDARNQRLKQSMSVRKQSKNKTDNDNAISSNERTTSSSAGSSSTKSKSTKTTK